MRALALVAVLLGCDARPALTDHADTGLGGAGGGGAGGDTAGGEAAAGGGSCAPGASHGLGISAARVVDADGDGLFEPGERVTVNGYVQTSGSAVYGVTVRVTADDARVQPDGNSEVTFYALPPGTATAVSMAFVVPEEIAGGSEVGFTLAVIDPDDPACVAASTEVVIVVSSSAWELDTCAMTRQLQLSEPRVTEADGDGRVEPGDDITLTVTLDNPGPLDHNWYPGVQVVSNDAGVTPLGYGDWLYALAAHHSASLSSGFHVDGSMVPGTVVRFVLSAAALNVRCHGVETLEYSILIQ
jgi:hypothetical protein